MVRVKLLFFAKARDLSGVTEREVELTEGLISLQKLKDIIGQIQPSVIGILDSSIVAVDEEYVVDSVQIDFRTKSIAIIPPVSGG